MRQTITQLLRSAYRQIDKLDADLLLSFALGKPREYLLTHENDPVESLIKNKFNKFVKKRKAGTPLAYITGHKEFFGLDFLVDKNTLIPRPDTEVMVEEVIKQLQYIEQTGKSQPLLIDVGTGSGCIPISIIKKNLTTTSLDTIAIDISKKALLIAKQNTKKHKVKIKFLSGNLLKPVLKLKNKFEDIIITANLPYLTEDQYQSEKSIQLEPKIALVAENEGLALYEELLQQIKQLSTTYNLKPTVYLEIDPSQSEKITVLIKKILPETKVEIKKDLAGKDRLVIIT